MSEITLTFPDGSQRSVPKGITGKALAESIAKSLAKRAVAMTVDGKLADLADPIEANATVKIVSRTDPEALELIRHDACPAHRDALRQMRIGPAHPGVLGARHGNVEMHDLRGGMHTRVRTPGASRAHRTVGDRGQRAFERVLNRPAVRLRLPTRERGSGVFDACGNPHPYPHAARSSTPARPARTR